MMTAAIKKRYGLVLDVVMGHACEVQPTLQRHLACSMLGTTAQKCQPCHLSLRFLKARFPDRCIFNDIRDFRSKKCRNVEKPQLAPSL